MRNLLFLLLAPLAVACGDSEAGAPAQPSAQRASPAAKPTPGPKLVRPSDDVAPTDEVVMEGEVASDPEASEAPEPRPTANPQVAWTQPASIPPSRNSARASTTVRGKRGVKGMTPSEQRAATGEGPKATKRRGNGAGVYKNSKGHVAGSGSSEPVQSQQTIKKKYTTPYRGRKVHNSGGGGQ